MYYNKITITVSTEAFQTYYEVLIANLYLILAAA